MTKSSTKKMIAWTASMLLLGAIGCGGADDGSLPGGSGGGACTEQKPVGSPSDGTVRFRFGSAGTAKAWVATAGTWCSAFTIDEQQIAAPYNPQCEGAPPQAPHISGTADADGATLVWDGKVARSYQGCADCTVWDRGIAPMKMWTKLHLEPGRYTATFGVLDSLAGVGGGGSHDWGYYGAPVTRCDTSRTVSVTFELPATGEAVVDVVVPQAPEKTALTPRDLQSRTRLVGTANTSARQ